MTICTEQRLCLFGDVIDAVMNPNPHGEIVRGAWDDLPNHYPHVELDAFVIMPNHVHGIIVLAADTSVGAGFKPAPTNTGGGFPPAAVVSPAPTECSPPAITRAGVGAGVGAGFKPAPTKRHGLPEIVRAFKTFSARRINAARNTPGVPIWQRNYYEHVIRNDESLNRIRQYIFDNPARWGFDRENPEATHPDLKEAWEG